MTDVVLAQIKLWLISETPFHLEQMLLHCGHLPSQQLIAHALYNYNESCQLFTGFHVKVVVLYEQCDLN